MEEEKEREEEDKDKEVDESNDMEGKKTLHPFLIIRTMFIRTLRQRLPKKIRTS